jgi:hypothetical protein
VRDSRNVGMIGSSCGVLERGIIGAKGVCDSEEGFFTSPIIAVCASPDNGGKFTALSCTGEVADYSVSDDTLEKLATHRCVVFLTIRYPVSCLESDIETAIQLRDFPAACTALVFFRGSLIKQAGYSKSNRSTQLIAANESEMIKLCSPIPPVESSWSIGIGKDQIGDLTSELHEFCYNLPPGFICPSSDVFEMIVLRFNLLMDVAKDQYESILTSQAYV